MKEITEFERINLVCSVCGASVATEKGLKIHKSRHNHWGDPSSGVVNAVEKPEFKPVEDVVESVDVVNPPEPEPPPSDVVPVFETVSGDSFEYEKSSGDKKEDLSEITPEEVQAATTEKYINPNMIGVRQNLLGSRVALRGTLYSVDPVNPAKFIPEQIPEAFPGIISRVWADLNNQPWLDIQVEGSSKVFVCSESHVIPVGNSEPLIRILRLGPDKKGSPIHDLTPSRKKEFVDSLRRYVKARDAKTDAEKEYKSVDEEERPIIVKYTEEFGVPSEDGGKDSVLFEDGYKVKWSYKENPSKSKRDDEAVINWCIQNGYVHALQTTYKVVDDVWDKLKASGIVPEEFVGQVETIEEVPPTRRLYVEKA